MKAKLTPLGRQEELSALMDGECKRPTAGIIIKKITAGEELFSTWERYHLIGETIRRGLPAQILADYSMASRIKHAIAQEPVIVCSKWRQTLDHIKARLASHGTAGHKAADDTEQ